MKRGTSGLWCTYTPPLFMFRHMVELVNSTCWTHSFYTISNWHCCNYKSIEEHIHLRTKHMIIELTKWSNHSWVSSLQICAYTERNSWHPQVVACFRHSKTMDSIIQHNVKLYLPLYELHMNYNGHMALQLHA